MPTFAFTPRPPNPIHDDVIPQLAPGVLFTVVDQQVVLYDPSRVQSHVLNTSAALVWAEVDHDRSVRQIVDDLERDTGADRAILDRDVTDTLARFVETGIVIVEPHDSGPEAETEAGTTGDSAPDTPWAEPSPPSLAEVEWTAVIGPVRALGTDVVARTNDPDAVAGLQAAVGALPPSSPGAIPTEVSLFDAGTDQPRFRVYVGDQRRWSDEQSTHLVATGVGEITQLVIDGTPGHVLFHAGAVERDGQVVVVAGDSGRGKSTLTAALVQRGFGYVTDEVVAIDPETLDVRPFAKGIDLDEQSRHLLGLSPGRRHRSPSEGKTPVAIERLGTVSDGGRLALVVLLTDIASELEPAAPAAASVPVAALLDLLQVTFEPCFADPATLDHLARIVTVVPVLRLGRGPLDDACDQIVSQVTGSLGLGSATTSTLGSR